MSFGGRAHLCWRTRNSLYRRTWTNRPHARELVSTTNELYNIIHSKCITIQSILHMCARRNIEISIPVFQDLPSKETVTDEKRSKNNIIMKIIHEIQDGNAILIPFNIALCCWPKHNCYFTTPNWQCQTDETATTSFPVQWWYQEYTMRWLQSLPLTFAILTTLQKCWVFISIFIP